MTGNPLLSKLLFPQGAVSPGALYGDGIQMPIWRLILPSVNIPIDKTRVAVLPAFAVVTILNTRSPAEPPAGQTRHRIGTAKA